MRRDRRRGRTERQGPVARSDGAAGAGRAAAPGDDGGVVKDVELGVLQPDDLVKGRAQRPLQAAPELRRVVEVDPDAVLQRGRREARALRKGRAAGGGAVAVHGGP